MRLEDFYFDPSSQVYVNNSQISSIGYRDGSEGYLADIFREAADVSLFSPELRAKIKDWPSLYHLSPLRFSILDCLGFHNRHVKVLELGAGCGAVTRWLGEHFTTVCTVEGSIERAKLARQRCRDLPHVKVFSANFLDVKLEKEFDIVTLIGVLEYSSLYDPVHRGNPFQSSLTTLKCVRDSLKESGVLVLAIENKFGIKYFSGAREDHSGRYFDSIQGYPNHSGAVTFGVSELTRLLHESGFGTLDFYLPFPDYKHATTIINAQVDPSPYYLHNWIETPFPDIEAKRQVLLFNEGLVVRELCKANLLKDLSNSFLILAYAGEKEGTCEQLGLDEKWIVKHYSLNRYPAFCKRTTLLGNRDGLLKIHAETPFGNATSRDNIRRVLSHVLCHDEYHPGNLLLFEVFEMLLSRNFRSRFSYFLLKVNQFILEHFSAGYKDAVGIPMLDGTSLDITPWNIIVEEDTGRWKMIDVEWNFNHVIPIDLVLWRNLYYLTYRYHSFFVRHLPDRNTDDFIAAEIRKLYPGFDRSRSLMGEKLEQALQFFVTHGMLTEELETIISSMF